MKKYDTNEIFKVEDGDFVIKKISIVLIILLITYTGLFTLISNEVNVNNNPMENTVEKEKLTIWGWDEGIVDAFEEFSRDRANVEIEFVYVAHSNFVDTLQAAMVTSTDLPDICILDEDHIKTLIQTDVWANLEEKPFNLDKDDLLPMSLPMVTNGRGEVVGIPHEVGFSGVAYRKSLMKKIIGSDKKEDVKLEFGDWKDVIEKGKQIKASYDGEFYMFASPSDVGVILINQTNDSYIVDSTLVTPEKYLEYFRILTTLRDENLIDESQLWAPEWYNSFKKESYLFYPWSIWMQRYGAFDIDGKKDWAVGDAPGGNYYSGVTAWSILKSSDNKELAWEFMEYFLMSYEGAEYNKHNGKQVLINYKPAYEVDGYCDLYHDSFQNQNLGKLCVEYLSKDMFHRQFSEFDMEVNNAFFETLEAINRDKNLTAEGALDFFITKLKESSPEIKIN